MSSNSDYNISDARKYWVHAPVGSGTFKADARTLENESDANIEEFYQFNLRKRFINSTDEILFVDYLCNEFRGKSVLSFGSGFGFQEIIFAKCGAHITCFDIVPENLNVIKRIAGLWNLDGLSTTDQIDKGCGSASPKYDCIYAHGSIHHMPFNDQIGLFHQFDDLLTQDGCIILMVYSDYFMKVSGAEGNAREFARYTDPDANDLSNPWSEAYDLEKLNALGGESFVLTNHQTSNNGLFAWVRFERRPKADRKPLQPFVDFEQLRQISFEPVYDVTLQDFRSLNASDTEISGTNITSSRPDGEYIALTEVFNSHWTRYLQRVRGFRRLVPNPTTAETINAAFIVSDISQGGFSIQLANATNGHNLVSIPVHEKGPATTFSAFENIDLPRATRMYISVFKPVEDKASYQQGAFFGIQLGRYHCPIHDVLREICGA